MLGWCEPPAKHKPCQQGREKLLGGCRHQREQRGTAHCQPLRPPSSASELSSPSLLSCGSSALQERIQRRLSAAPVQPTEPGTLMIVHAYLGCQGPSYRVQHSLRAGTRNLGQGVQGCSAGLSPVWLWVHGCGQLRLHKQNAAAPRMVHLLSYVATSNRFLVLRRGTLVNAAYPRTSRMPRSVTRLVVRLEKVGAGEGDRVCLAVAKQKMAENLTSASTCTVWSAKSCTTTGGSKKC